MLAALNLLGLLFESLVVRDPRVLAGPLRGRVNHYRDASGLEADAVVELPGGDWAAFVPSAPHGGEMVRPTGAGGET